MQKLINSDTAEPTIKFKVTDSVEVSPSLLFEIEKAVYERRKIKIKYRSLSEEETVRVVNPLKIIHHDGVWILYAYCNLRQDYRSFAIDRIKELKVLNEKFTSDLGEVERRISKSFGVWEGQERKVVLQFSREVSALILRKPKWHEGEEREILPDGSVKLSFTVSGLEEIRWWIYSWIPYVKIIEPMELKEIVREELRKTLEELERN